MFSSEDDELLNERDKQPLPDTTVTEAAEEIKVFG